MNHFSRHIVGNGIRVSSSCSGLRVMRMIASSVAASLLEANDLLVGVRAWAVGLFVMSHPWNSFKQHDFVTNQRLSPVRDGKVNFVKIDLTEFKGQFKTLLVLGHTDRSEKDKLAKYSRCMVPQSFDVMAWASLSLCACFATREYICKNVHINSHRLRVWKSWLTPSFSASTWARSAEVESYETPVGQNRIQTLQNSSRWPLLIQEMRHSSISLPLESRV